MGKILVLAEKPSVGKELARVLGCRQSKDGSIHGAKYIVTWSLGHLVTLADPEYYGEKYKTWSLESLPMLPAKMELVPIKETAKQFKNVKMLLHSPEVESLVIATDAGREGELVARWIIKKAGFSKPIKRLWISSQTDKAIKDGFLNLKPSKEYDNLYKSASSRAEADWFVGLNVTRALTCKFNAQLSAGRVQTPTLAMIIERENEINKFMPKDYYTLTANLEKFNMNWRDKNNSSQTFDKLRAEAVLEKIKGKSAKIINIKKEQKREQPPLLYDLTELQRDANKKYGFSAKQTLSLMQKLYEQHKILTYPRTDSRYLTDDIIPTLPDRLKSISGGSYKEFAQSIIRNRIRVTKRFCDNSKVTDHHAIIPTEQYVDFAALTADEKRIYDLVVKRFLSVLMNDYAYEQTTAHADIGGESFSAKGKFVTDKGWKSVYDNVSFVSDEDDEEVFSENLPKLNQGDTLRVVNTKIINNKTKPPKRYTEASLLSAMEHPGKFIENEKMREIMDASSGIGTPATRADIIEKLFSANYVERRGKEIFPLSKGIQLINIVPPDLKSPELTAKWEQRLSLISKGQASSDDFIIQMKKFASSLVSTVVASDNTYRHDNLSGKRCPECDKFLLEINGKKGKMLVCQDRECGYRENLSFISNARCPTCHKKLEVVGKDEGKRYFCKCGFREKFDRFNERLSENRNNMSKNEVSRFLQTQSKKDDGPTEMELKIRKAMEEKNKKG